jgi:hypothetical protein
VGTRKIPTTLGRASLVTEMLSIPRVGQETGKFRMIARGLAAEADLAAL